MSSTEDIVRRCVRRSNSRFDLWINFVNSVQVGQMVEIGVYRGSFASQVLRSCDAIAKYYMIDPWRRLDDWNKPANKEDNVFEQFLSETLSKTDFAMGKRIVLRGRTTEVIDKISDADLDFAYIDGDHTLRGIAIDLIRVFPKVKVGGWIGGDDFSATVWEHSTAFEPTLVFPFAVYFAEAVGCPIYGLPYSQFLVEKTGEAAFRFIDLAGEYADSGLRNQFDLDKIMKLKVAEAFPLLKKLAHQLRHRRRSSEVSAMSD